LFVVKVLKQAGLVLGFIAVLLLLAVGTYLLSSHILKTQDASAKPSIVNCKKLGTAHQVIIQKNVANPVNTYGKLCDTLTISNQDNQLLLIAFGPHENHQPYDGITERVLDQGQSLTITFNEVGTYHFHDHISDIIKGNFTVTK
jgi:hypothetical protein